ncbi:MAG: MBL fold metallo-hydrolase [Lachnospiraceae bacterium]
MEIVKFYQELTNAFWGEYSYQILFYLSLILIWLLEKNNEKKVGVLWYSVFVFFIIYNPLIYYISQVFFTRKSGLVAYYSRLFYLIPAIFIIAYAMVLVLKQTSGRKKVVCTMLIMVVLAIGGHSAYGEDWFVKAQNVNKVPEDVKQVSCMFPGDGLISIMAPSDLVPYMRQIDSRFSMPYGRDASKFTISNQLQSVAPDVNMVLDYAIETNTEYLVVIYNEEALKLYMQQGCEVIGYTNHYVVIRQPGSKMSDGSQEATVTQYYDDSGLQAIFYTIETETGKLILIDGGSSDNVKQVRTVINDLGGTVDAWILTHYHKDHVDAFNDIYADPQGIVIKQIYDSPIDYGKYIEVAKEWDFPESYEKYLAVTKDASNITHLKEGDTLDIDGLSIYIFGSYGDVALENGSGDIPNNASLVFKIAGEEDSILFCSDCHDASMADYFMDKYTSEELHAKYVQLGHHGNNSFPTYFYDYVNPDIVLFDSPEWLMTGESYSAKDLKEYFEDKDIICFDYTTAPNKFAIK